MLLGQALDAAGDVAGLVALARAELAALAPTDPRHLDATLRLARLLADRQGNVAGAAEILAQHDEVAAREELEKLADRLGDAATRRRILEARVAAGLARTPDHLELASLAEGPAARAEAEAALALDPTDPMALWVAEHAAVAAGDMERAIGLYRGLAGLGGGRGRTAAMKLAAIAPADEVQALLAKLVGVDADAAWYMVADAARRGDGPSVVARLVQLAHLMGETPAGAALLREASERAEALALPDDDQAAIWERLRRLARTPERSHAAQLDRTRRLGDADAQAAVLAEVARLTADPARQATATWMAGLALERSEPAEAGAIYLQAAETNPDDPVPLLLGLRLGPDGAPLAGAERAARLEAIAARLVHDGRAAQLLATAARLREGDGDDELAAHDWLQAAFRFPEREQLARKAEALLADAGETEALLLLLERRVRRLADPAARLATQRRLAQVHIDLAGDRPAAVRTWETIVAAEPHDFAARVSLADLLVGLGRYAEAVEHYRRAAVLAEDRGERIQYHTRAGELLARHLRQPAEAIEELRKAVGLFDPSGRALEVLAEVYLLGGEHEQALLAYQRLERTVEGARRSLARAGQVRALMAAGRDEEARERLRRFLALDAVDPLAASLASQLGVSIPPPPVGAEVPEPEPLVVDEPAPAPPSPAEQAERQAQRALDDDALDTLQLALAGLGRSEPPAPTDEADLVSALEGDLLAAMDALLERDARLAEEADPAAEASGDGEPATDAGMDAAEAADAEGAADAWRELTEAPLLEDEGAAPAGEEDWLGAAPPAESAEPAGADDWLDFDEHPSWSSGAPPPAGPAEAGDEARDEAALAAEVAGASVAPQPVDVPAPALDDALDAWEAEVEAGDTAERVAKVTDLIGDSDGGGAAGGPLDPEAAPEPVDEPGEAFELSWDAEPAAAEPEAPAAEAGESVELSWDAEPAAAEPEALPPSRRPSRWMRRASRSRSPGMPSLRPCRRGGARAGGRGWRVVRDRLGCRARGPLPPRRRPSRRHRARGPCRRAGARAGGRGGRVVRDRLGCRARGPCRRAGARAGGRGGRVVRAFVGRRAGGT
ncbi:MAG: hypothetical protein R3F60_04855 [bacterium]